MTPFHINLGQKFAKPFESRYNMLRRCLVANPGIRLTTIEGNLRLIAPEHGGPYDRLQALQHLPGLPKISDSYGNHPYTRQCPQCAQHLYHTEIFLLPWLTKCPIHHCNLTTICPECQRPWPDKVALDKRDCSCCGRLTMKQLHACMLSDNKDQLYHPIAEIYKLIQYKKDGYRLHNRGDTIYDNWWQELTFKSLLFPACQVHTHPNFSKDKLASLHINLSAMLCKSSQLYTFENKKKSRKKEKVRCYELDAISQERLASEFVVMRHILAWISRQMMPNHQIHLMNYHHVDMIDFIEDPTPCPYCLALSLWFCDMVSRNCTEYYAQTIFSYKFLRAGAYDDFFHVSEPYLTLDSGEQFSLNRNFSIWFYCRGLEILFMDIQRFVFESIRASDRFRKSMPLGLEYLKFTNHDRNFRDQLCSTALIDGRFFLFYENEHPLNTYKPPHISRILLQCSNYKYYMETHYIDFDDSFFLQVPNEKLSYQMFLSLFNKLKRFVQS